MTDKTADELPQMPDAEIERIARYTLKGSEYCNARYLNDQFARYIVQRLDAPEPRLTAEESEAVDALKTIVARIPAHWDTATHYRNLLAIIDRLSAQPKETGKVELSVNCDVCGEGTTNPCRDADHAYTTHCWRYDSLARPAPEKAEGETP